MYMHAIHVYGVVSFDRVHDVLRDLLLIVVNVMLIRAVISHLILLLTCLTAL